MIFVKVVMNVRPEKQKELVQTLLSMMAPMQKRVGCQSCSFLCDIQDKNRIHVFEEWENREMLNHYLESDIFGVLLGIKSLLRKPHSVRIYTVQQTEGINAIRKIRRKRPGSL